MRVTLDITCANITRLWRGGRLRQSDVFASLSGHFGPILMAADKLTRCNLYAALNDESLAITESRLKRAALWDLYLAALALDAEHASSTTDDRPVPNPPHDHRVADTYKLLCWHHHLGHDYFVTDRGSDPADGRLREDLERLFNTVIVTQFELLARVSKRSPAE